MIFQTIHFVKVEIPAGPLMLQRKFWFQTPVHQLAFIESAKAEGYTVTGHGIEHLISAGAAIAECKREAESIG